MSSGAGKRILYDADCGFCRWALGWELRLDHRHELLPLAIQDPEAQALLAGVPAERRLESWHLVDESGIVVSAGAALAPLLADLRGGRAPAALARRAPRLADRAYRRVAANRSRLGRPVSDAAKLRADELIAARRAEGSGR